MKKDKRSPFDATNTDLLFRQGPLGIGVSLICAVVYMVVMWRGALAHTLVVWLVAGSTLLAMRAALIWLYFQRTEPATEAQHWNAWFTLTSAASGLTWGLIPYLFFAELTPLQQMFTVVLMTGIAAGGMSTMSSVPSCYRYFLLSMLLPLTIYLRTIDDEIYPALVYLAEIFIISMLFLSHRMYATLVELQRSRQGEEYRNRVMEMLADGSPLSQILEAIVHGVEAEDASAMCTILQSDSSGEHMLVAAAPNLPDFFNEAINGLKVGPDVGSCGAAIHSGERVIAEDIRNHANWADFRELALRAGVASCWSEPIKSSNGKVMGAFAIYHRTPSAPEARDIANIERAAHIAGLAMERKSLEQDLEQAAMVYQNSSEAMVVTDADNRVIAINAAFTQVTGYGGREVLGKEMIFSSRNARDVEDYRRMMDSVLASGQWQGELWNFRKNGERFASRVTVNSIHGIDNIVYRRVILLSDITEQKRADELIWKQANYDPLIGLPNRRLFRDRLEQEVKKSHRASLRMGLLFLDLDRFKEVNDSLGHDAGDKLLVEAARRICSCVRESDSVARLGGDEFTIILSEIEDSAVIERVARDIIAKMAEAFQLGDDVVHVSVSIGITVYPDDSREIDDLLKNADLAMYAAKNAGRNRYSYFTSATQKEAQNRVEITNDLHKALDAGEFELYFQPIIDLASNKVNKAEALIRWHHPTRGLVSPAQFIPRAEETGLIIDIGDWAFREAARTAKRFSELSGQDFQISVNVSPVQCHAMADCDAWVSCLEGLGLSGHNVTIEITEGLLLGAAPHISKLLLQFRNAGINVAIDDFGTGYSSLSYLKRFDIDFLKIDQSFVRDLATDPNDRVLAETIIVMGHKLGLRVIAEGVETEEQCRILTEAGCDFGQGYLFSRPMPADEFAANLISANHQPGTSPFFKATD